MDYEIHGIAENGNFNPSVCYVEFDKKQLKLLIHENLQIFEKLWFRFKHL